jgi:c-di-GMP-binding flagellar brake protein YcgR
MHEKRKFPRFAVTTPVHCFRYGRQLTLRTVNVSLGGLKLEANFDLGVGESMNLAILANGSTIQCKGRVLAIEDFRNKVYARLRFDSIPDQEYKKLSNYLYTLYWGRFQKWVIGGILILLAYIAYVYIHPYL